MTTTMTTTIPMDRHLQLAREYLRTHDDNILLDFENEVIMFVMKHTVYPSPDTKMGMYLAPIRIKAWSTAHPSLSMAYQAGLEEGQKVANTWLGFIKEHGLIV